MFSKLLSIYIPTYNRPDYLEFCINNVLTQAKAEGIKIFISDNCSSHETKDIIDKYLLEYSGIFYHKQEKLLSLDENQIFFTSIVDTKYCLMLADDDALENHGLSRIIKVLLNDESLDLLLLNAFHYSENMSKRKYLNSSIHNDIIINEPNYLLKKHFFHMHYSTLVVKMEFCSQSNKNAYYNTYHAYCGIVLDYLANKYQQFGNTKILFISEPVVMLRDGIKTYSSETIEVYFSKFPSFFTKRPIFYATTANKILRLLMSKNVNISFLARLKLNNILSLYNYKSTYNYLTHLQKIKVFAICIVPVFVIKIALKFLHILRSLKNIFK